MRFVARLQGVNTVSDASQGLRSAGFLNGCVLTFVNGPLANISTRIVGYSLDVTPPIPLATFRVLLPNRDDLNIPVSLHQNQFVINGRAFSGTGAGYVADGSLPEYGQLRQEITINGVSFPHALLPNRFGEAPALTNTNYLLGGLNESYDAADYQNVALAALVPDPNNPGQPLVLPSFHPVSLINYWSNHSSGMWDPTNAACPDPQRYREFRRAVVFRPMPWDHPHFDGGNLALMAGSWLPGPDGVPDTADDVLDNDVALTSALINGPWDVDCDGDGTRDAMWLDLGAPIQTDPTGRRYKPLYAILCTDMDGKLNLNAHGNLSHLTMLPPATQTEPLPVVLPIAAGSTLSNIVPYGQGYGPPEISLAPLFASLADEYRWLLQGNPANGLPGRYGFNALPGDDAIQPLAQLKMLDFPPAWPLAAPTNYFYPTTPLAAFSSPYDLRGEFAFGLDYRGMPLWERSTEPNLLVNTAYELNLSANAPRGMTTARLPEALPNTMLAPTADTAFSTGELERLLRPHDVDAPSLPDRLWHLVDVFRNNPTARRGVTTDSYDPPSPGTLPWPELRAAFAALGIDRPRHILDVVRTRLIAERGLSLAQLEDPVQIARLNSDLALLLSPEVVLGVRMDVNRPFGNGQEEPSPVAGGNNRIVDDHGVREAGFGGGAFRGEEASNETIWGGIPFDHDNDGDVGAADNDAFRARHLFAKHLYVLMMAIKPANVQIDFDGTPPANPAEAQKETAYGIAQWAINVADFRDSDSIMTPFEFDLNPFNYDASSGSHNNNGWDVDGVLGTADDAHLERGLVWGCERPELLITEAIAFHDRRTEDLSVGGGTQQDDPNEDFDQRLRPRGSFFVELYNPWAGDERAPGEFYYNGNWAGGVMLNQVTEGPHVRFPVWRLIVVKGSDQGRDPDHWNPAERMPVSAIERSVYFTPFPGPVSGVETPYFTNLPVAPILPGRYALIGSAGQSKDYSGGGFDSNNNGTFTFPNGTPWEGLPTDYVTTLGRRTNAQEDGAGGLLYNSTRRIVLEPNLDANQHQAQVWHNSNLNPVPLAPEPNPNDIQPAVAVVINRPRSLSVSEPVGGYPDHGIAPNPPGPGGAVWDPAGADYEGEYTPALDEPLDTDPELMQDGTTDDYCVVHLQRLASPVLPYDPVLNPYRTIDTMSCDLSAFNGVTSDVDSNAGSEEPRMTTRERGRKWIATDEPRALWKHEPAVFETGVQSPPSDPESVATHYADQVLRNTFGYLNESYGMGYSTSTGYPPITPFPAPLQSRPADFYKGAPFLDPDPTSPGANPFPWLTWNNRPFVSQYELMLVPKSRSSRLPYEYAITPPVDPTYAPGAPARFGHLLNFFQTSDNETDLYFNPTLFTANPDPSTTFFRPPFNRISNYRDPGRINLNTIYDEGIWAGLLAGHPGPTWERFISSRRGYDNDTTPDDDIFQPNDSFPSFFANPFRPVGAGRLVPPPLSGPNRLDRLEVETTLLRSNAVGYDANPSVPWLANNSNEPYNSTDRNPYFQYQGIDRLGNLVTTRSNVYAVWITVGFFEVEPSPDANTPHGLLAHPDGFRLGKELGSDAGTAKRHRAFYLIDRTIPVAFEPG
ncbi:MAG: hypothetical protein MUF48_23640, partial [Pirellulaceae bacterium]|nr:hypothetical protein [Pirellulaceae bacterium]